MTKARILANLISDNAELADGQISVAEVVGAAPLASPTFTGTASGTFSGPLTGNVTGNLTGDVTAPEIDLTAIAKDISDTAVDVFVYDTSRDSDCGAWRKRTQHTSWYNEAASSTRGSRKEFPAVAVIVVEADELTIYDGDDPDLPMWMVFSCVNNLDMIRDTSAGNLTGAAMKNAVLSVANRGGPTFIDFIKDNGVYKNTGNSYLYKGNIEQRNDNLSVNSAFDTNGIVNNLVNDVAMTVLPNAPIDAATGLPVPTIAVATGLGTSIIRDDGTVVDYTLGNYTIPTVDFDYDNNIIQSSRNIGSGGGGLYVNKYPILSADSNSGNIQQELVLSSTAGDNTSGLDFIRTPFVEGTKNVVGMKDSTLAFSSDAGAVQGIGVYQLGPDGTTKTTTLGAVVTSDYNTGWMNGEIKLATLSDTDDTDVTGSELVTGDNSTFTNGIGDWYDNTYGSTLTNSGGYLTMNNTSSYQQAVVTISNALVVGETYVWSWDQMSQTSGNFRAFINSDTLTVPQNATGSFSMTFVATSTDLFLKYKRTATSGTCQVDNISVRLAEEDRSVNGNGLQVFGTVTKNPVATGADLVAYSGFSSSNYLEQPYNSDLDFGTGDFCYMGWVKTSTGTGKDVWLQRTDGGTYWGTNATVIMQNTNGEFLVQAGGAWNVTSGAGINDGRWHYVTVVRRNGVVSAYWDTNLKITFTGASAQANGDDVLRFGIGMYSGGLTDTHDGSLALWRISATAPSPEQIAKIYNDEKHLFQTGVQATLYGSSDAVTALAYDDDTELLHVGTSAGRSVFQGLRRVDNTTDAVGAAISASNGLVAED